MLSSAAFNKAGVRVLVSLLEDGVSNRQPQVAHIKWESQEAAANMSVIVAYISSSTHREKNYGSGYSKDFVVLNYSYLHP